MGVLDEEGLPMANIAALAEGFVVAGMGNSQIQLGRGESHSQSAKRQTANGQRQSRQKTVAGLVTHANFITLTPGTVSVDVDEREKCDFGAWPDR